MRMVPKLAPAALVAVMVAATSGCTPPDRGVAQAPVTDPYVATGDGGARYVGNVGRTVVPGALPGAATPEAFAASAGAVVGFPSDQVALSAEGRASVGRQAAWLARHKDFRALIEGHADEQGTREFNLALGARRAASVQEYLIAQGIEPSRITTVSYGNERPAAECDTDDCAARNRRTVTVVSPGGPVVAAATPVPAVPDVVAAVPDEAGLAPVPDAGV